MDTQQEQDWMAHYRSAMLEVDLALLGERIRVAEQAIEACRQTLVLGPNTQRELRDLNDALQNLRVLKRELTMPSPVAVDENHSHPELEGTYVAFVSSDRRYVAVTDGVCQLLGYSREELLTKKIDDLTAPELKPAVPDTFQQYVQQGHLHRVYVSWQRWPPCPHPLRSIGFPRWLHDRALASDKEVIAS